MHRWDACNCQRQKFTWITLSQQEKTETKGKLITHKIQIDFISLLSPRMQNTLIEMNYLNTELKKVVVNLDFLHISKVHNHYVIFSL